MMCKIFCSINFGGDKIDFKLKFDIKIEMKQNNKQPKITYLIQANQFFDKDNAYVKIGHSSNPEKRRTKLLTGTFFALSLIGTTTEKENIVQKLYEKYKITDGGGREWFKFPLEYYETVVKNTFDPYENFDLPVLNQLWKPDGTYKFHFFCPQGLRHYSDNAKNKKKCLKPCCQAYMTTDEYFWINYFLKYRRILIEDTCLTDENLEMYWNIPEECQSLEEIYGIYTSSYNSFLGPVVNRENFIRNASCFWFGSFEERTRQFHRHLRSRTGILEEPLAKYLVGILRDTTFIKWNNEKTNKKKSRMEALCLWFGVHCEVSETFWIIADAFLNRARIDFIKDPVKYEEADCPDNYMFILMHRLHIEVKHLGESFFENK